MSRRTLLSLVAIVCGLAAVLGAVLRLTTDERTVIRGETLVQSSSPIVAINTPTIRRNPTNADNVVVTYRVNYDYFSAFMEWSQDGGRTFTQTELPLPSGTDACAATLAGRPCPFAADIAFADDGTLYAVYVNLEGQGNVPAALWLSRSTDGGRTLQPPTRVAGRLTFQPRIAVAPDGTVHLTWLQAKEVGLLRIVDTAPVVTVRSTDGGQTFSDPVVLSDTGRRRVGAASPVVSADGAVTVLYQDYKGDRRDFENLDGPVWDEPFGLVVTRSTDGGRTWSPGVELESGVVPSRRFLVFLPEFPSLAAGPGDSLYVSWADSRNGDEDVWVKRSGDGGQTWTAAVRVNDNPTRDGTDQSLPKVAVNSSGRIFVLYLDRRADPQNVMADVSLSTSDDNGQTWSRLRISSAPVDSRVGAPPVDPKLGVDLGSRLGLDVWGNKAYAAWVDTRESDLNFGAQDVAVTQVSLAEEVPLLAEVWVVAVLFLLGGAALVGALFFSPEPSAATPGSTSPAAPAPAIDGKGGGTRPSRPRRAARGGTARAQEDSS